MINLILAIISGLLTGLGFDFSWSSFLVWFSLVPFLYIIARVKFKTGLLASFLFGIVYYGAAIFWVGNVTKLGLTFLLLYLSLYKVVFFLLGRYFFKRPLRIITLSSLWVVLEFLKENVWCGFGWANLGYSQYRSLYLIQAADLLGTKFISFLIISVNLLIYEIAFRKSFIPRDRIPGTGFRLASKGMQDAADLSPRRFIFRKIIFTFLILSGCFIYSFYRLSAFKDQPALTVSVAQPNIPQKLKWDENLGPYIFEKLTTLAKDTKENSLVIFPESAWPQTLDEDNLAELKEFAKDIKRDLLIGVVTRKDDAWYNAAVLIPSQKSPDFKPGIGFRKSEIHAKSCISASGREPRSLDRGAPLEKEKDELDIYRKIKLVPFGEYIPLRKYLSFIEVINLIGDISRGKDFTRFSYNDKKFSVLICFEDIFPLFVSKVSHDNDFMVNITNDAWFGGEPEASQHLGIMVMRAIENRISIVRCANTGISGWVSFKGEIEKLTGLGKEVKFCRAKEFNIALRKERSFYNKTGEIFPLFCILFLLIVAVVKPTFKQ